MTDSEMMFAMLRAAGVDESGQVSDTDGARLAHVTLTVAARILRLLGIPRRECAELALLVVDGVYEHETRESVH